MSMFAIAVKSSSSETLLDVFIGAALLLADSEPQVLYLQEQLLYNALGSSWSAG